MTLKFAVAVDRLQRMQLATIVGWACCMILVMFLFQWCELRGMRKAKIVVYACCVVLVSFSLQWWGCGPLRPGDWALKLRFVKHRAELEQLVAMTDEDRQMTRIAPDFLWTQETDAWPRPESEWGITETRWDKYRRIFRQVGFDAGVSRGENDVMVFVWAWGIVAGEDSISYLHCGASAGVSVVREPACTQRRETGGGYYQGSKSAGYRYRKIGDDWYILEQFN